MATDADFEWFQLYGRNSNNQILAIINMIQGVYQNTFNLEIVVVFQHLFTTVNDPYTADPTTYSGSFELVIEMQEYWESNFDDIHRDLAHLFVGRDSGEEGYTGRSFGESVCANPSRAYGYSRETVDPPQFMYTAHEIGHSIGGIHDDGQYCGTQNATVMCEGQKAIPLVFSTASINRIEAFLDENSECLSESPSPTLSDNNPYSEICNGDAWTYTCTPPQGYPADYGFDWYATGGLKINGQSTSSGSPLHTTSNTVTVTAPSSAYGTAYVYVRLNNNVCTHSYVSLGTQAGPYSSSQFSISGPSSVCPNNTASYLSTLIDPSITNYQWGWSGFTYQSGQGTPYLGVYAPYNFNGGSITLRLQNRCGLTGSPAYKYVYKGYCGYGFSVNPNPVFTELTILIESPEDQMDIFQSPEKNTVEMIITDEAGLIVMKKKLERSKEVVDVSKLKPDIYYLKIFVNDNQIDNTKRIVKK